MLWSRTVSTVWHCTASCLGHRQGNKFALHLQDYSPADHAEVAYAALEVYASAGRYQRAIELWQTFWKSQETDNGPAAS